MEMETLKDLYVEELKDLYSAENQIIKALPKMIKAASHDELKDAFSRHLKETEVHVQRIAQVCDDLGVSPKGKKCVGMEGLIKEGQELIKEKPEPEVLDAALITAAQKVEHYEIATYGCLATYAKLLGLEEDKQLLGQTLQEEKATDGKLTILAESLNMEAAEGELPGGDEEGEEDETESDELSASRRTGAMEGIPSLP